MTTATATATRTRGSRRDDLISRARARPGRCSSAARETTRPVPSCGRRRGCRRAATPRGGRPGHATGTSVARDRRGASRCSSEPARCAADASTYSTSAASTRSKPVIAGRRIGEVELGNRNLEAARPRALEHVAERGGVDVRSGRVGAVGGRDECGQAEARSHLQHPQAAHVAHGDRLGQRPGRRPQLGPVGRLLDGGLQQHGQIDRLGTRKLDDDVAAPDGLDQHAGMMRAVRRMRRRVPVARKMRLSAPT